MATITQTISTFPTAPDSSKDTPPEFNTKADAFVNHQSRVYVAEVNNWATQANSLRDEVNTIKSDIDNTIANLPTGTVNDTVISTTTVWSSKKTSDELSKAKPINNMAVGNINNPLLDMPLNNSIDTKQGVGQVTFTRSTTATYIDRYGVLKSASVNEPRFNKDGLLIESASTNKNTNSVDVLSNHNGSANETTTVLAPDGNPAHKLTNIADGEIRQRSAHNYCGAITAGKSYSRSIFVKAGDGSNGRYVALQSNLYDNWESPGYAIFDIVDGEVIRDPSNMEASITALKDGWFRISLTSVAAADNPNIYASVQLSLKDDINVPDSSVEKTSIYYYGLQFEEHPFATSYIPTDGAEVTRASDILLCDAFNNHPSIEAGSPFSFAIDAIIYGAEISTINRTLCSLGFLEPGVSGNSLLRVTSNGRDVHYYRGIAPITAVGGVNGGETYRIVVTVSTAQEVKIYVDGKLVSSSTHSLSAEGNMASKISIGCSAIGTQQIGGVVSNFRVWDKELSEEEARLA